jgi:hypothetical protein
MQLPRLVAIGRKPRRHLAREIAITLAVKLLLLYGLWSLFFSRPAIDSMIEGMNPDRVAAALAAPPTPSNRDSRP